MAKKHEDFFFNNFVESIAVSCEAASFLQQILSDFNADSLKEKLNQLHEIEHHGDSKKHELSDEILRAFITPLERDDIMELSQNIDNVTDGIEDILIHIYITGITTIRPEALHFASLLINCCEATKNLLVEFPNFKKSKILKDLIIEINRLEEEGDKAYIESLRTLYTTSKDPMEVLAWRSILNYFENCLDACEDVADVVQNITIGNT
jgi:predicted phosphate transport protein (TIGR00153 family)